MKKEDSRFVVDNVFEGMVSVRTLIENRSRYVAGLSKNDRAIQKVYYEAARADSNRAEFLWLTHRAEEQGFILEKTDAAFIQSITVGSQHGGVVALADNRTIPRINEAELSSNGFYVMLEGIEDPYNFGYALRSLYASGVDGVILTPRNWMTAAGVVCRASAGASELLPLYTSTPDEAVSVMKNAGYRIVCADLRESVSLFDADLSYPIFLIIGGEKRGISRSVLSHADLRVHIDYAREFSASLSAASAATIAGYEIFRYNRY